MTKTVRINNCTDQEVSEELSECLASLKIWVIDQKKTPEVILTALSNMIATIYINDIEHNPEAFIKTMVTIATKAVEIKEEIESAKS